MHESREKFLTDSGNLPETFFLESPVKECYTEKEYGLVNEVLCIQKERTDYEQKKILHGAGSMRAIGYAGRM